MNQFLPSSGLTGAKRRLGTSQHTQINVLNCLVILSSHGRPSVAATPGVTMVGSHIEDIQCLYYDSINSLHTAASDTIEDIQCLYYDIVNSLHTAASDTIEDIQCLYYDNYC